MSQKKTTNHTAAASKRSSDGDTKRVALIAVGSVIGLGLIIAIAVSAVSSGSEVVEAEAFGQVTLDGNPLPVITDAANDPAIGQVAPNLVAESLDKTGTISITADGRPKVLLFLAHWCNFCQAEVPAVQDFVDAGGVPENVDFYAVSTLADRLRTNFPPRDWLEREGWTVPTVLDNENDEVQAAFGMSGTPYWLALDGNGRVLWRAAGSLPDTALASIFALAADSAGGGGSAPTSTVVIDSDEMLP